MSWCEGLESFVISTFLALAFLLHFFGDRVKRKILIALLSSSAAAAFASLINVLTSPQVRQIHVTNGWTPILSTDKLSCLMLCLITLISLITFPYAQRMLEGDKKANSFLFYLALLAAANSVIVASDNLFVLAVCWCAITPLFIRLTKHHINASSIAAASNLFKYNLAADLLFLAALGLLYFYTGKDGITETCMTYANGSFNENLFSNLLRMLIPIFLVLGAITKSAVFPFHKWLFATLESPTPFSAFLHAGLVNIAGFLCWRFSPVIFSSKIALGILLVFGSLSALCASVFSAAQTDVKRKLVFSTIAQMGFMCLQSGLGSLSAALFHLVWHGFYKNYLFLDAGSAISSSRSHKVSASTHNFIPPVLGFAFLIVSAGVIWMTSSSMVLPAVVFAISIFYEYSQTDRKKQIRLLDMSIRFVIPILIFFGLYTIVEKAYGSAFEIISATAESGLILTIFSVLMLSLWMIMRSETYSKLKDYLYTFALNGGYLS